MGALATYHFGHLPVWVEGNAYFNGASVCKHEKNKLVNTEDKVTVEVLEKDGTYSVKSNVFSLVKDFKEGIITSDILGYAFEPEQRFENPDGSAIIFDRDYLGNHRGVASIPGPFAECAEEIQVWC